VKRKFKISFSGEAVIEIDDSVLKAVDDDWKKTIYNLRDDKEVAEHIGYNLVVNGGSLSNLDGFADQEDDKAKIIEDPDWELDIKELEV